MRTVSLVEAKTHLSSLVDQVAAGNPFVVTKHGRPVALMTTVTGQVHPPQRIGFLRERFEGFELPSDFDSMMAEEIQGMFEGNPHEASS
ncbi:MAG: type II toxin-antitoxin system prevent-host-death family antitoxin [Bifidobacteriaceae bacterium]|nr:type II toxin-antitoxin system prevent-host-death family antitoxin [Bifidobacteriaceae bacterium]